MMNNATGGAFFELEERVKVEVGHKIIYHIPLDERRKKWQISTRLTKLENS